MIELIQVSTSSSIMVHYVHDEMKEGTEEINKNTQISDQ